MCPKYRKIVIKVPDYCWNNNLTPKACPLYNFIGTPANKPHYCDKFGQLNGKPGVTVRPCQQCIDSTIQKDEVKDINVCPKCGSDKFGVSFIGGTNGKFICGNCRYTWVTFKGMEKFNGTYLP